MAIWQLYRTVHAHRSVLAKVKSPLVVVVRECSLQQGITGPPIEETLTNAEPYYSKVNLFLLARRVCWGMEVHPPTASHVEFGLEVILLVHLITGRERGFSPGW
jgi:hypothetical protein